MASVTNLKLSPVWNETFTYVATWDCSLSNVDYYSTDWRYGTGQGLSFQGDLNTVSQNGGSMKQDTYTAPNNANLIAVYVKPVSKTHTVNGKETSYWTGSWVRSENYNINQTYPPVPPTPSIEVDSDPNSDGKYKVSVYMDIDVSDQRNWLIDYVEFHFRRNSGSGANATYLGSVYAQRSQLRVQAYMYVSPGYTYAVAARSINNLDSGTKTSIPLITGTTATLYSPLYSEWSAYTSEVSPPPDTVSSISCSAYDETTIKVTWSKATGAEGYEIQYSKTKEYLEDSSNDTQTQTVETNTDTAYVTNLDSGEEWYLRIRATNSTGNSPWSSIVSAIIGKEPEAPTTWSSTTVAMIGDVVNLYWVHNCEDNSEQHAAEIELRTSSTYADIVEIEDDTREYALDTSLYSDGTEISWRVRTMGILDTFGEWSTTRTIKVYAPATLGLEMSDTLSSFPYVITAESGPSSQKAISYHISVFATEAYEAVGPTGETLYVANGEEIYSKLYNTNLHTTSTVLITLSVGDLTLQDGITYKVVVTAAMDSGLSVETTEYFTVHWDSALYNPEAAIGINTEELVAYITPYCERLVDYEEGDDPDTAEREYVPNVTLSVYRREPDGTFTLIGDGIENDGSSTIVDPHPGLDYARYRVVAQDSTTGQISYEDVPGIAVDQPCVVIQWDEDWMDYDYAGEEEFVEPTWTGSMLKFPYNIDISEGYDPDVSLKEYVGRSHPVSYYGTQKGSSSTWNSEIPKSDTETINMLRRLSNYMGDVYVREQTGTGYWAQVTVSMTINHKSTVVPVTFNVKRVEGGM